jgi:hypothetical protein
MLFVEEATVVEINLRKHSVGLPLLQKIKFIIQTSKPWKMLIHL